MNAKVHHCWVTPSQPSEAWGMMMEVEDDNDGGWDDNDGGWDDDDGGWRWGRKKRRSTLHVSVEFEILCLQLRVPCLLLFPILIIAFSSLPPSFLRVDLVSPITLNLAFFISFWLGVGNACPLVCTPWSRAKDNTLRGIFVPLPEHKFYCPWSRIHLATVTVS